MNDKFLRIIKKLGAKDKPSFKSPLVKKLPKMFFFTDRKRVKNIFAVVENLPKNSAIIIREYDLDEPQRLDFAQEIMAIAKKKSLKVLVGKNWQLAVKIKADGVHFSDWEPMKQLPKHRNNQPKDFLVSYSCHSEKAVRKAQKYGCDLIFYSPIFATKSHLGQRPIGSLKLRNLASKTTTPIYALGGVNEKNIQTLINSHIAGIGGISMFDGNV